MKSIAGNNRGSSTGDISLYLVAAEAVSKLQHTSRTSLTIFSHTLPCVVRLACPKRADQALLWEAFTGSKWEPVPKGQGNLNGMGKGKERCCSALPRGKDLSSAGLPSDGGKEAAFPSSIFACLSSQRLFQNTQQTTFQIYQTPFLRAA